MSTHTPDIEEKIRSRIHELKTWPSEFREVRQGRKRFEFRLNDRDFAVGDVLRLREWDPAYRQHRYRFSADYTRSDPITCRVTHILHGGRFGVPEGYCVMSIEVVEDRRTQ